MKGSGVLSRSQWDAVRLISTQSQEIKKAKIPSQANSIILSSFKNHEGTHEGIGERGSVYSCRGQFPGDTWWLLATYCTVCACSSLSLKPCPSGGIAHPMPKPLSCVLMSATSGPHFAHLPRLTYNMTCHRNKMTYYSFIVIYVFTFFFFFKSSCSSIMCTFLKTEPCIKKAGCNIAVCWVCLCMSSRRNLHHMVSLSSWIKSRLPRSPRVDHTLFRAGASQPALTLRLSQLSSAP